MFKVVPDQLRISDGWVRCGQCDEVFDANAHLLSGRPATEPVASAPAPVKTETPAPPAQNTEPQPRYDLELPDSEEPHDAETPKSVLHSEGSEVFKIPADWPAADETFADPFLEKSPQELSQFQGAAQAHAHASMEPKDGDAPGHADVAAALNDTPSPRFQQASVSAHTLEEGAKLSFLHSGAKASRRRRPWLRRIWMVLCMLLSLLLALQFVVQERDRIAASEPAAAAALASLCAALDCKVLPLRQIESVSIDSSAFTKVRADAYRLNFTLKNSAPTAVATPAVELTLTDSQDQAVVRKVFSASEFGAKQESIASGAEFSASLPLNVKPATGSERISGYRLLAFYP